jgi:hypothetical protein
MAVSVVGSAGREHLICCRRIVVTKSIMSFRAGYAQCVASPIVSFAELHDKLTMPTKAAD